MRDGETGKRYGADMDQAGRDREPGLIAQPVSSGATRREQIAEAVIRLIGESGARHVTHRRVDKFLGVAEGTTSAYFRRTSDLLHAGLERLSRFDLTALASLRTAIRARSDMHEELPAAEAAELLFEVWTAATNPAVRYMLAARFEYFLLADRDPEMRQHVSAYLEDLAAVDRMIFERMGARDPNRAAAEYGIWRRGLYFSLLIAAPDFEVPLSAGYFEQNIVRLLA